MTEEEIKKFIRSIGGKLNENMPQILEKMLPKGKEIICAVVEGIEEGKRPRYMDCVVFSCKKGMELTTSQQEYLEELLCYDYEGTGNFPGLNGDRELLTVVEDFIFEYAYLMGGLTIDDDFDIGREYVGINFIEEHPYNKEDLDRFMDAMNQLLKEKNFNSYIAYGHDKSWDDEE